MSKSLTASDIVLAAPVRTPIGRFGGSLAPLSAADLGVAAAAGSLKCFSIDSDKWNRDKYRKHSPGLLQSSDHRAPAGLP